jgi:hypothetical protein
VIARRARSRVLAWAVAVGCAAAPPARAAGAAAPDPRAPYAGAWRVDVVTHVRAAPVIDRDVKSRVDLVVREGRDRRAVSLEVEAEGYLCRLEGRVLDDGALDLRPGQTCPLALDEPDVRGTVEARLRTGRGRLRDRKLELELAFDLSGSVSARIEGGTVSVMGRDIVLPDGWAPPLPLRGSADARGEGRRASAEEPAARRR